MTRKMMLIAGAAGLALTAPVAAQKGDNGRDKQAQVQRGGGIRQFDLRMPIQMIRQSFQRARQRRLAARRHRQGLERPGAFDLRARRRLLDHDVGIRSTDPE